MVLEVVEDRLPISDQLLDQVACPQRRDGLLHAHLVRRRACSSAAALPIAAAGLIDRCGCDAVCRGQVGREVDDRVDPLVAIGAEPASVPGENESSRRGLPRRPPENSRDRSPGHLDVDPIFPDPDSRVVAHSLASGPDASPRRSILPVMSSPVDDYIEKSELWPAEISALRPLLLGAGLDETIKWGKPCYSHGAENVAIMQEMKDFLALMFFKGALLDDPDGVLEAQGPNSRSARRVCFSSAEQVERRSATVKALLDRAIVVAESGAEVGPPPELVLVDELQDRLDGDPALKAAFEALTPGRRREYQLHISGAKQAKSAAQASSPASLRRCGAGTHAGDPA